MLLKDLSFIQGLKDKSHYSSQRFVLHTRSFGQISLCYLKICPSYWVLRTNLTMLLKDLSFIQGLKDKSHYATQRFVLHTRSYGQISLCYLTICPSYWVLRTNLTMLLEDLSFIQGLKDKSHYTTQRFVLHTRS
jgi:hypothetical protein